MNRKGCIKVINKWCKCETCVQDKIDEKRRAKQAILDKIAAEKKEYDDSKESFAKLSQDKIRLELGSEVTAQYTLDECVEKLGVAQADYDARIMQKVKAEMKKKAEERAARPPIDFDQLTAQEAQCLDIEDKFDFFDNMSAKLNEEMVNIINRKIKLNAK